MKKLATLFLLAAACGPGLVEFPVVPPAPGPGGGENPPPPQTPADCSATLGTVLCGTQCVPLGPTNCGLNTANGFCEDCTAKGPGFTCSAGACVPPTTCAAGLVVCATGCCTATQVAAGGNTSCAIVGQGATTSVYCWGANDSGQLGPAGGAATSSGVATEIADLHTATAVAIGTGHGCAILGDQNVMCWGKNDAHQLGPQATTSQSATPVLVPEASGATAIAVGDHHSCAITPAGAVCWGLDDSGQTQGGSAIAAAKGATKIVAGAN
ncbi:MAG: RCC1 domain-containing protein, partial [Myxococcales bacterium]